MQPQRRAISLKLLVIVSLLTVATGAILSYAIYAYLNTSPLQSPSPSSISPNNLPSQTLPDEYEKLLAEQRLKEQREVAYHQMLQNAVNRLPKGEFFHTVPKTMTADVPVLIEAGIAQKITTQVLKDLQIRDTPEIKANIPYDPFGVEVKLDVDKDFFKVREIKTGIKPIINGFPESWLWELTPTKQGKSTITLLVVVQLKVPGLDTIKKETVVFKEEREVQVNLGYSISKFTGTYWKEISTLLFGSGSVAWIVSAFLKRKGEKSDGSDDNDKSPFGFARLLEHGSDKKAK